MSLQPGFLVMLPRKGVSPVDCLLPWLLWDELKEKGFYGGLIMTNQASIASYSDEDLRKLGLMRIPRGGPSA